MISKIPEGKAKEEYVKRLFSSIAGKYDTLNQVLSLSLHHRWRKEAVRMSGVTKGSTVLDICTGTGDLAFCFADFVGEDGKVIGTDFAQPMLDIAVSKAKMKNATNVSFAYADASDQPFDSDLFDCVSVAFGLRNTSDVQKAVFEMARCTKPGGYVVSLEIGRVKIPFVSALWKLFFCMLTPVIASLFRAKREAYEYLPESVQKFMSKEELTEIFSRCGLVDVVCKEMTFGAVYLHVGKKTARME